ncbi:Threonine dehydratase biosynthetic, chloroplastic [Capsicum annuum]|nr:Threonine dehydratase biosynthetic, chloroplastic [Capsicum annuum]
MEFLCLAPTHNFPNNSKFPTICPSGHNTKTSPSRVRPLAVPLKISQLISSFNPFEPEVSTLRSLENIETGELIVNNPTGGDKDDIQYFLDMLSSPVYDVAVESPLQQSMNISERLGVNFYMKREDRQSDVYDEEKNILETSGALAIAGAEAYCKYYNIKNENIVAIASGANMDFSKFKSIMDLANIGAKKEALLATFMPEEPGSFKRFTQLVGSINITEFKYRFNSERKRALVLYSVDVPEKIELEEMLWRMESSEMHTVNLSNNNLVNDHLRHLIGSRSHPRHEILCQFIFPEKPGALRKFVDAFSPRWNITLFHYRDQGEVDASVLVGFQVQKWEMGEFQYHVNNLGYPYEIEIHNEAYKLIMD